MHLVDQNYCRSLGPNRIWNGIKNSLKNSELFRFYKDFTVIKQYESNKETIPTPTDRQTDKLKNQWITCIQCTFYSLLATWLCTEHTENQVALICWTFFFTNIPFIEEMAERKCHIETATWQICQFKVRNLSMTNFC